MVLPGAQFLSNMSHYLMIDTFTFSWRLDLSNPYKVCLAWLPSKHPPGRTTTERAVLSRVSSGSKALYSTIKEAIHWPETGTR